MKRNGKDEQGEESWKKEKMGKGTTHGRGDPNPYATRARRARESRSVAERAERIASSRPCDTESRGSRFSSEA